MEFVEDLFANLFYPLQFSLLLILLGVLFLWLSKKRQLTGKLLVTLGMLLLTGFSLYPVSSFLAGRLESEYEPFRPDLSAVAPAAENEVLPKKIVVLNGGYSGDQSAPTVSRAGEASINRIAEGIRLFHGIPGSVLYISEPATAGNADNVMTQVALILGVPADRLVPVATGRNTQSEAVTFATLIGQEPFLLVTSAVHMPRAMKIFQANQMNPVPAPADFQAMHKYMLSFESLAPQSSSLEQSRDALHEYMGCIWGKLTGQM